MEQVDKDAEKAKYLQLVDILIEKIEKNLSEDDRLESERELCDLYEVSRTTVRQAMGELEKRGYIYKVKGKGTFISTKRVKQHLDSFYSFTNEMRKLGKIPKSEILGFEIIEATKVLREKFNCSQDNLFYKITRLRKADDVPMIHEITYLPFEMFENLTKKLLKEMPMYEVLKKKYSILVNFAEEYFEPVLTEMIESLYLKIPQGSPSLKIERFTYECNRLIEYTVGVARGDKFKYVVRLQNNERG